ncbi:hypothetical protein [Brevibacillus choshinensis]|uniref:hypothetical protein n=1 Tax=Brevibacillus choshinensis TaxID=54911 RepID=UPI002E1A46F0|nr:hypothetical protein [Brevibacillus choshinensis]
MPNSYWYGGLVVLSLLLLGYALWKTRDGRLLVLHFCLAGLIDPLEYFILILFPAYQYFPSLTGGLWLDNMLGSFSSNDFIVPAVAVTAAAFHLRFVWLLLFSILFMVVEWLFLWLDLYGHFWWKLLYSGIGILIFLLLGRHLWTLIQRNSLNKPITFFYTFFVFLFVYGSCHFIQAHALDVHDLSVGWFPDQTRDHIAVSELIEAFVALIASASFFMKTSGRITMLIVLLAFDGALLALEIMEVDNVGELLFYVLLQLISIFVVHRIVKYGMRREVS